jgi:glycerophosphoryl diester phosphodiesterase
MKKILLSVVTGLALICSAAAQTLPVTPHSFVVVAHRGNHLSVPENTVASIEAAISAGVDYAELDLRTTRDGKLVLMHNGTVDKMTNGKGRVDSLTFDEIRRLQVKSNDGKGYQVPTFEEALQACKGKLNIYLDFKDADVAETWRQIQAAGMEKQVVVYLNAKEQYKAWRKIAPGMPLMTSLPEQITTPEGLESFLKNVRISVLDNIADPAMIAVARKYNVAIWQDVQSENEGPAQWKEAIDRGIQGVQTDHPEALVRYLNSNGLRDGVVRK